MKVKTRFAPSPTGHLHIGNVRTALINWLYARQHNGEFILRIDNTDVIRSKLEYEDSIKKDLQWLGMSCDHVFEQSSRAQRYEEVKKQLIDKNILYPCYETPEEIDIKRKLQLSMGRPPIYDRSSLRLSQQQISQYVKQGRKPHYRFFISDNEIIWEDMIKGTVKYHGSNLSDPVIIREDGTMTYMLCSTVDDIDFDISHIIRGEDHISNSAIQIQMFNALGSKSPILSHLSLIKSQDSKISKREGGFEVSELRDKHNIEAMTVNSFLANIGSSNSMIAFKDMESLIENFDIHSYSKSPTTYFANELEDLNHKLIINYNFNDVRDRLQDLGLNNVNEQFWSAVKPNLSKLKDIKEWWDICYTSINTPQEDKSLLLEAAKLLPEEITVDTWSTWIKAITQATGKKGKDLFRPLRLALTGKTSGPELKKLLPLLNRQEILKRLQ